MLAIWLPAGPGAFGARAAFAILFGFFPAAMQALVGTLVAQLCPDVRRLGVYVGAAYLAMSPALLISLPIGGALVGGVVGGGSGSGNGVLVFPVMKLFGGLVMLTATVVYVVARSHHLRMVKNADPVRHYMRPRITLRFKIS